MAEQHALASLEFSLRKRFSEFCKDQSETRGVGLKKLLKHAIRSGQLKNELFTTREQWAWKRAEMRYIHEIHLKMHAEGLKEIEWSESDVVVTQEDSDSDWLGNFLETIPDIRNRHAHGSGDLMPSVRHTFEVVTELINQLYPNE